MADFSLLGAAVYPNARYETLKIATLVIVWLFVMDDELDMEDAALVDDIETSDRYRQEIIQFTRKCLGLPHENDSNAMENMVQERSAKNTSYRHIVQSFAGIGAAIRDMYNVEQRERLAAHLVHCLRMTKSEQFSRQIGRIPTPDEYWEIRDGASAVGVTLASLEFIAESKGIPRQIFEDHDMTRLWTLTNMNVSYINDIFSAQKELAGLSISNAVPVFYAASGPENRLETAIKRIVSLIATTIAEIDEVSNTLLARYGSSDPEEQVTKDLRAHIDGCKNWCTGNLHWSLETPRYGHLGENADGNGGITIQL
ncbi:uncharacterized protein K452DRAFT_315582 [Aplosporella prunicola CBS 121167]|uniref:Terpene synthase n=1 Tax=Aplosporella prunicola CBS 121167 TaxID=1176127 RepID=A0A6A6BRK0_9PEZI|nr:uncharacterized protein K452DRAFT_315582 [Aplosporella prunicola CBS 121167]KAF2146408.1 hypothetical protein K452DRAFT_315582 [Aplosporella prunicola CBS 121167]